LLAHGNVAQFACKVDRVAPNRDDFIVFGKADPLLRMITGLLNLARERGRA
jgi:hypothetical protein